MTAGRLHGGSACVVALARRQVPITRIVARVSQFEARASARAAPVEVPHAR